MQERDQRVLRIYEQLLEIEQRLIPTGLHIFGRPPEHQLVDLLRLVASFDRPELGVRSLPDLVAGGLGLPPYAQLLQESATSESRSRDRARVEQIVTEAITRWHRAGQAKSEFLDPKQFRISNFGFRISPQESHDPLTYLAREASVPENEASKVFQLLARVRQRLAQCDELQALMRALRGEYIEPGPGADIVQNPDILPTGRNIYAVNPYTIPSLIAFKKSEAIAQSLLQRHRAETGSYPEAIAVVLWGMDNIKTQGEGVAQVLWLLGVQPRRDALNRVTDVTPLGLERLGRPRIDVVMTVSGIFRDLFGPTMELLDRAVRVVAHLDEPSEMNFIKKHLEQQVAQGFSPDESLRRVFSNAAGNYGTHVDVMVTSSQWKHADQIGDLFVRRKGFAYGQGQASQEASRLLDIALERVEATYQNIDSSEIGITDVDHYFEYLGGLSQAVQKRARARPKIYLSDALTPHRIRTLEETIRLETRTKTLNPKWYEGMLKHGFSGVAQIERHVTNTFGWSATADAVDDWIYDEIAATYVLDDSMLRRLQSLNPHSTHSLVARLLEAHGRGFWRAEPNVIGRLHEILDDLEDQLERFSEWSVVSDQ